MILRSVRDLYPLLPAIFTENGLLISHLRYLSERYNKSQSWKERSIFSIRLLIKYININKHNFSKTTDLLRSFTEILTTGSIDASTLEDPSNLYWDPRKYIDASNILFHITSYTDYLTKQDNHKLNRANPFRKANCVEERLNWCAYYHKHAGIFLNHLIDNSEIRKRIAFYREINTPNTPMINTEYVTRFPETEIDNLLSKGFIRPYTNTETHYSERYDFKNQAITLLMHYGGLRKSEVFQIYINDILVDKKRHEAIVRVYHPSNGNSPSPEYKTRREFLAKTYNLLPRTEYPLSKRQHCGWKSPLLTDKRGFFQVIFCPPQKATEFLNTWENYLKFQRTDPPNNFDHPYAFTNKKGHPETIKNFQRLHKNAVNRIGFESEKYLGTTEHAHRHSYGYRLSEAGLNQVEIQKAMHHKSPDSCAVYISPTNSEIRNKLNKIEE